MTGLVSERSGGIRKVLYLTGPVIDDAKSELSGASPVSLTPANTCFAVVNDTGEYFFVSVVDTGEVL